MFCPLHAINAVTTLEVACGFWAPQGAGHQATAPPPRSPIGSNASPVSLAQGVHAMPSLCARPSAACGRPNGDSREGGLGRRSERQEQLQMRRLRCFCVVKNKEREAANCLGAEWPCSPAPPIRCRSRRGTTSRAHSSSPDGSSASSRGRRTSGLPPCHGFPVFSRGSAGSPPLAPPECG